MRTELNKVINKSICDGPTENIDAWRKGHRNNKP